MNETTNDINQATLIKFPGTPLVYRVTAIKPNTNKIHVVCEFAHNEGRLAHLSFRGTVRDLKSGKAVAFK
ncbi:hypothetical protein EBZ39_15540 [bacterium]|nr:hypothetical protein [bacterium]